MPDTALVEEGRTVSTLELFDGAEVAVAGVKALVRIAIETFPSLPVFPTITLPPFHPYTNNVVVDQMLLCL